MWANFQALVQALSDRYDRTDDGKRTKIVVVLGDGFLQYPLARDNASTTFPRWTSSDFKREIIQNTRSTLPEIVKEIQWQLGRQGPGSVAELADDNTVTTNDLCAIACGTQMGAESLRSFMVRKYRAPYGGPLPNTPAEEARHAGPPPHLASELLAHLLKHGFIDHVISLNIDDLLEEAIENELGRDDSRVVVSDHAVVDSVDPRPYVIKLHGSIRDPSTLRFERGSVLTPRMAQLLNSVIFSDDSHSITLVSLGYSWSDHALRDWLRMHADRIRSMFVVRREVDQLEIENEIVQQVISTPALHSKDSPLSIGHVLWAICQAIEAEASAAKRVVVPAARHIVLGWVFGPRFDGHGRAINGVPKHEPKKRFLFELALHTAKCRGMVTISSMAGDRRLSKYRAELRSQDFEDCRDRLLTMATDHTDPDVLEVYRVRADDIVGLAEDTIAEWDNSFRATAVVVDTGREEIRLEMRDANPFLSAQLKTIATKGWEVEILRGMDTRYRWSFKSARPLERMPEIRKATDALIATEWTHLFAIAETGEWLVHHPDLERKLSTGERQLLALRAEIPGLVALPFELGGGDEPALQRYARHVHGLAPHDDQGRQRDDIVLHASMWWWEHNRHLTLGYDKNKRAFTGCVWFHRHRKALRVSYSLLNEPDDCAEALRTFVAYSIRALVRSPRVPHEHVGKNVREDDRDVLKLAKAVARVVLPARLRQHESLERILRRLDTEIRLDRRHRRGDPQPRVDLEEEAGEQPHA